MTIDGSLEGVAVAQTALAYVDGRRGVALVRGYPLPDLAAACSYEDVARLVLRGELPASAQERAAFRDETLAGRTLTYDEVALARAMGQGRPHATALAAAMVLTDDDVARTMTDPVARAVRVLGRVPEVCAAITGDPVSAIEERYAERAMRALGGVRADAAAVRALEVLLCLEAEHGLSASTFACRVAASSGADAGVALSAAVATLSGPRHGGATADARTLLLEAQASGDVKGFVEARFARKARLPGFGHRIYKVADPRLPPLRAAMHAMGGVPLLAIAEALREHGEPLYGAKGVHANIDLFAAALLDALGVDPSRFVAAFALGLASGWLAHWVEQRATGRLVRPESEYVGVAQRAVPAVARG